MLAFATVLVIFANAALLHAQKNCVPPVFAIDSLPSECQVSVIDVANVLANVTQLDFTGIDFKLGNFCMPECIQPFVDYYTCLGETDYANILDGLLCGNYSGEPCLQLWMNAYNNLNGDNPNGVNYTTITLNCRDPLTCNADCSTELNKAVDLLGCCLAGIVEFNLCGALEKVRFDECSIHIPPICAGVTNASSTPAPIIPTTGSNEGTNCVDPRDDADYPADCNNTLAFLDDIAMTLSSGGFTPGSFNPGNIPSDYTTILDDFCTPECVGPLVGYYRCTGEPDYASSINGVFCGKYNDEYCLISLPSIFQKRLGFGGRVNILTIRRECNNALDCSDECMTELTEAKEDGGCCLAGAVEFTLCGPLEQARFDECGINLGSVCQGVDLMEATETTKITDQTEKTDPIEGAEPTEEMGSTGRADPMDETDPPGRTDSVEGTNTSRGAPTLSLGLTLLGILAFLSLR